jgi:hypothetical protein
MIGIFVERNRIVCNARTKECSLWIPNIVEAPSNSDPAGNLVSLLVVFSAMDAV